MLRLTTIASVLAAAIAVKHGSPWPASASQSAKALLAQMTLAEKLSMVYGSGGPYVGNIPPITHLNIPPSNYEDGPQGVADGVEQVTCWPSALTVVASWNTTSMYLFGEAMGAEQYIKGTNVMLGPAVNLARVPWGGRTFEYTGEDPFLSSSMVTSEVQGIQSQNISACVKHFVENNQEYDRSGVSANVPRRPHMELYMQPFSAAVDAGVGTAMCSYNRVNRTWACENNATLISDLKQRFGFEGAIMSDWGATHSTIPSALGGLDIQMPDSSYFGTALATAVANGQVPESRIDDMVTRILTAYYATGVMQNQPTAERNLGANATSDAHNALARDLAQQSTVLLKNTGNFLPANANTIKSVVVLGDDTTVHGSGSGGVIAPYIITPTQGIYDLLNGPYNPPPRAPNCTFYPDTDFYQPSNPCVAATDQQDCCAICTATVTCNAFAYVSGSTCATPPGKDGSYIRTGASGGACWLKNDDSGKDNNTGVVAGTCPPNPPPPAGRVNVTSYAGQNATIAAQMAVGADLVVVNVATSSSEGSDRTDLSLPQWQNDLVYAVLAANPNTVVVARCPGACFMPWAQDVSSILFQLMPGQESGNVIADAVFGNFNPSGKLPVSFPASMDDTWLGSPVNPLQYPGTDRGLGFLEADYDEGLFIGYRWYDAHPELVPLWPFGHGISYTTFDYSNIQVTGSVTPTSSVTISFTVTNSGKVGGAEVAQLYVAHPAAANEPPKALKGFNKFYLAPGANQVVSFTLSADDIAIFDLVSDDFLTVPGTYGVMAASSSVDIRLTSSFTASN